MFRLIIRNLAHTLRRYPLPSAINLAGLVVAFSVIAAILALCGVIGLVLFDTEYRRKETAVRKIFGASVASILERANISYGTVVPRFTCGYLPSPSWPY